MVHFIILSHIICYFFTMVLIYLSEHLWHWMALLPWTDLACWRQGQGDVQRPNGLNPGVWGSVPAGPSMPCKTQLLPIGANNSGGDTATKVVDSSASLNVNSCFGLLCFLDVKTLWFIRLFKCIIEPEHLVADSPVRHSCVWFLRLIILLANNVFLVKSVEGWRLGQACKSSGNLNRDPLQTLEFI